LSALLAGGGCQASNSAAQRSVPGAKRELVFSGMCDASGAVEVAPGRFAVADDEANVLRVYDADRGGPPLLSVDVSDDLHLPQKKKPNPPNAPDKPHKAPEADIEAATRLGEHAFWLTSHGRSNSGKLKSERHRFFATTLPHDGAALRLVGVAYESLFSDLVADPRLARFDLAAAAERAPKAPGGFNIEGMTARLGAEGVLIGFRNPIPQGRALLVPLLNPEEVTTGSAARFGDPIALSLGGLGVRSLTVWHGKYLIAAGHFDRGSASRLYTWDGRGAPRYLRALDFSGFNPEAFFTPEDRDEILVLSDDGSLTIDGEPCKKLKDPSRKRFRGAWLELRDRE
jgi:hypothetical protein